jgi:hypothetical protein
MSASVVYLVCLFLNLFEQRKMLDLYVFRFARNIHIVNKLIHLSLERITSIFDHGWAVTVSGSVGSHKQEKASGQMYRRSDPSIRDLIRVLCQILNCFVILVLRVLRVHKLLSNKKLEKKDKTTQGFDTVDG